MPNVSPVNVGTIFSFVKTQEAAYKVPVPINDLWSWSMEKHVKTTVLYKNSQLLSGKTEFKPVKNITRPILNLQYRAEGFAVKDITVYIDDSEQYFKSLLVRKFHQKWALENKIDTVIDAMVESYCDFGGALLKNVDDVKPEVVPLESIAFCDQTDILSGPICLRHFYSPDQLLEMESKGWGNPNKGATATLQEVITLGRNEKKDSRDGQTAKTPGKYIEIYEIHGCLPNSFLDREDYSGQYSGQIHIIAFYISRNTNERQGITLFKAAEPELPFKFIARDKIYGRALGLGGAEELFEAQVWTNYDMIRVQDMLDAASKVILQSTDPAVMNRNKPRDMENLEIMELAPGTEIKQIDTVPRSMALFDKSVQEWEIHARTMGGATDALMGEQSSSGTPFALQNLLAQQGQGLHEYRKGKLAVFWDEVERDWILPYLIKEITKGSTFLAELDLSELQFVSQAMVTYETNNMVKKMVLDGQQPTPDIQQAFQELVQTEFKKKGNKHFIEILKNEFKDVPMAVRTNIAGKQKDLADKVAKLTNIFRTIIANPYILQSPPIAKLFNDIVEASGLQPIDLSNFRVPRIPAMRITERMDFKDLPQQAQQEMLDMAGYGAPDSQPSEANLSQSAKDTNATTV